MWQRSQYYQYFEIIDQIFFEQFPFTTFPCSLPQFLPDRSDGICLSKIRADQDGRNPSPNIPRKPSAI